MQRLVGHEKQKQVLMERIAQRNLPSALIFHGPSGIGKKALAKFIVRKLNCENLDSPCEHCSSCIRSGEEKNEFIYNVQLEEKKSISVDQIRDVHRYLSLQSPASARFVIIDPADALTQQAANSLLKILEEPPENTYFILVTEMFHKMLPTVRSRAQVFGFGKLTPEELKTVGGFDDTIVMWADGRFDVAIELQNEDRSSLLSESLQLLNSLIHEQPQDWKSSAPWFFNDDKKRQLCFSFWNQALHKKLHGLAVAIDWLPEQSNQLSFIFENIEMLRSDIQRNVDKQLAVESFFYQLKTQDLTS